MIKRIAFVAVVAATLTGCTSRDPSNSDSTRPSKATQTTSERPGPSPLLGNETQEGAKLIYSHQGRGPMVMAPGVVGAIVSVRFTCVGTSKATSIKSVPGGGTIMRTDGCLAGEIFGATFTRSATLDPAEITLTVDPDTYWQIQVWEGKYVQHGTPASTGTPAASA